MKRLTFLAGILYTGIMFMSIDSIFSQGVAINENGNPPDNSAMLDVSSTLKGLLVPRMTAAQRDLIPDPANGLLVYVNDDSTFYVFAHSAWVPLLSSSGPYMDWIVSEDALYSVPDSAVTIKDGEVGIGAIVPTEKLEVNGTIYSTMGGIKFPDESLQTTAANSNNFWSLTGNAGANPVSSFIGTTDSNEFRIRVNNRGVFRIEPDLLHYYAPNIIGGIDSNKINPGIFGATISGGGLHDLNYNTCSPNIVTGHFGTIGGGCGNTSYEYATVGGGYGNCISNPGFYSSIGGGQVDTIHGYCGTISGGKGNYIEGSYSTIAGGVNNAIDGPASFIGGGSAHYISGGANTIGGGGDNEIIGEFSTIAGGGFLGSGNTHIIHGDWSVIGGGGANIIEGDASTISGGSQNHCAADLSFIGGGNSNTVSGIYSIIGGGQNNEVNHDWGTIGGGQSNTLTADYGTIGGGTDNVVDSIAGTISGGGYNTTTGNYASIGGGYDNTAGYLGTIAGGGYNTVLNSYGSIGGGSSNTIQGKYATIPGGKSNSANGKYSFAAGRRAISSYDGCFVWADTTDADFTSSNTHQFLIRASGGVGIGTNEPSHQLTIKSATDNSLRLIGPDGGPWGYGARLNFGDGDYVYIEEDEDDKLYLYAGNRTAIMGGYVGIGTTAPSQLLTVNNGTTVGTYTINGWQHSSDRRLKTNIAQIDNALEIVTEMEGVYFYWLNHDDDRQVGLIAQDVENVLPEVIQKDDKGYYSISYGGIVPVLIEAIKELKAENELLKTRVEALENR